MAEDQTTPPEPASPPDPPSSGTEGQTEALPSTPDPQIIRVREFSEDERRSRREHDG